MLIEKLEDLQNLLSNHHQDDCILSLSDNKSGIVIQNLIVRHPIDFLRDLPEFSQKVKIPVTDVDIRLIGFVDVGLNVQGIEDILILSPYIYYKKPDDISINVGSDGSTPSVES